MQGQTHLRYGLPMKISKVTIKGFRSLSDVEVSLKSYTCLVGANDAGKSSFLRAIQHVFEDHPPISIDDPTKDSEGLAEHYIEVEFEGVPPGFPFAPHGVAKFRRRFNGNVGLFYWGDKPKVDRIAQMAAGILKKTEYRGDQAVTQAMRDVVDPMIAAAGQVSAATARSCHAALEAANLVEKEPDWTLISSDDLKPYIRVYFLSADARAEDEMGTKESAIFYRLGGELIREAAESDPEIKAKREAYEAALGSVKSKDEQGRWKIEALNDMEAHLQGEVSKFDSGLTVCTEPQGGVLSAASFGMSLSVSDGMTTDVRRMGHGCRRSVMFAMLETLAHMRALKAEEVGAGTGNEAQRIPCDIFLIEEPELYLHPQKERERMRMLQALSDQISVSVIVATHSPFFVDIVKADGIVRFVRESIGKARALPWSGDPINIEERDGFMAMRFFHPTLAAMAFARLVIIVDGETESQIFQFLAQKQGLQTEGVEVVGANATQSIPYLQRICNSLRLPYTVWADRDARDATQSLKDSCAPGIGKVVVAPGGWESLAGITVSRKESKPWASYQHFVIEENEPNDNVKVRLAAAYSHQDHDEPLSGPLSNMAVVAMPVSDGVAL